MPLKAIVHQEIYRRDSDEEILEFYKDREVKAWNRYMANPDIRASIDKSGIENLAQYYTSEYKYSKVFYAKVSSTLLRLLKVKSFWNF